VAQAFLLDANGFPAQGRKVSMTAASGSAVITSSSAVTDSDGQVTFQITDLATENLTLTTTDTTDGVTLTEGPPLLFVAPPAAAAGINAFPSSVAADGKTPANIIVTLQDALGRPSPGKQVQLSQVGGSSVITGPIPPVTDSSGTITFTATDVNNETVTYSAVDVTDGNLPFPTTGAVTFSSAVAPGCQYSITPGPGYVATPYVTGFAPQSFSFGDIDFTCTGAYGMAFDSSGNFYASDFVTGNLYKFPPGGGVLGSANLLSNLGPTLGGLIFDNSGNFYVSREATTGNFTTGAVMQVDPNTGAVIQTVSAGLTCPLGLYKDPLSGDLFTDDNCFGAGSNNPSLWRISGLPSSPVTTVYATMPQSPNDTIAFAPSGTMYVWDSGQGVQVTGTNGPTPPGHHRDSKSWSEQSRDACLWCANQW
jgi:hypothetical protein